MKMIKTTLLGTVFFCMMFNNTGCKEDTDSNDCVPEIAVGDVANGDFCQEMDECQSGFCLSYGHTPHDPDAVCAEAPDEIGAVHVTGNVTDFYSGELLSDVEVNFSGAMNVLQKATGFDVYETVTSDKDGRVDVVLPADIAGEAQVGLVVVLQGSNYYPTGTGLAEPEIGCNMYPPGIRNRDMKMASTELIESWSELILADYPKLNNRLPLGDKAGVIGSVRYTSDGTGVADCHLKSRSDNSRATVLYLNEAEDAFVTDVTASNGFYVVLGPGMAEKFDAVDASDKVISRREATMGETNNIMFATTIHVDDVE